MHITAARISMYVTCGGCPTLAVMKKNLPRAMLCMRSSLFPGYTLQRAGSHLVPPHKRLWRPVLDFPPSLELLREAISSSSPAFPRPHCDSRLAERAGHSNNMLY